MVTNHPSLSTLKHRVVCQITTPETARLCFGANTIDSERRPAERPTGEKAFNRDASIDLGTDTSTVEQATKPAPGRTADEETTDEINLPVPGAIPPIGTGTSTVEQVARPDPYPERPTSTTGVRQHHHLTVVPDRIEPPPFTTTAADPSFTASFQPLPAKRRPLLPIASTTVSIFGQAGIGALTATTTVEPAHAIAISVGWLTCSIAVIFAQCASIAANRSD